MAQVVVFQREFGAEPRRLKAEIGIALAAAAEHGEIQALLHRVAHGHVHAVLHVALAAVERVRRHIADAGGGKLMPRNAQRNGIGADGGTKLAVFGDDEVVILRTEGRAVELGQQTVKAGVEAVHAEYVIQKIN